VGQQLDPVLQLGLVLRLDLALQLELELRLELVFPDRKALTDTGLAPHRCIPGRIHANHHPLNRRANRRRANLQVCSEQVQAHTRRANRMSRRANRTWPSS